MPLRLVARQQSHKLAQNIELAFIRHTSKLCFSCSAAKPAYTVEFRALRNVWESCSTDPASPVGARTEW